MMKRLAKAYVLLFSLLLTAFTVYALLDSFVIRRVYQTVETAVTAPQTEAVDSALLSGHEEKEASVTANSYEDDAIRVELSTYRAENSTVYVAELWMEDADCLRTAFSQNSYGKNVTAVTSDTAEDVGAILAINGDNYGSRETGYVIRNGVLYRDKAAADQEDLVVYADGSFAVIRESEVSAQELLDQGAVQVFSFGPGLLEDGEITVGTTEEVDRAKASNPRTAIGIMEPGHYVLVVSDGRTDESEGLSLYELAAFLQSIGVQTAYNLDGGGSSTMVFLGQVVNQPTSGRSIRERAVTDIIYI